MVDFCPSCEDISRNLYRILAPDLDFRTGNGREEYMWHTDIAAVAQSAAQGCTFCGFVDYVFLQPYYDPQSLRDIPTRAKSHVKDLSDEQYELLTQGAGETITACVICSAHTSKNDAALCYKCRPRVARYLALHAAESQQDGRATTIAINFSVRKASWALDEGTDVEGIALKGYIESSSGHALNTDEMLFRVDCNAGRVFLPHLIQRA